MYTESSWNCIHPFARHRLIETTARKRNIFITRVKVLKRNLTNDNTNNYNPQVNNPRINTSLNKTALFSSSLRFKFLLSMHCVINSPIPLSQFN